MARYSLLNDLIDLHAALGADRGIALDQKKQRDRKIGTELKKDKARPAKQIRAWLDLVEIPSWKRDGRAGTKLYHALGFVLVLLGLLSGWGLAQAALHYTGAAPINIVSALVVLILPQLILLLFWLLAALPRRLPLIRELQSTLRFLHPGRLTRLIVQRFPGPAERQLQVVWDPENAVVLASAARWLFSFWSQLFSFSFNVGVLLAVFYLITFSDLAFAWSTTLTLDNETFHRMLTSLSWPWHALVPTAVPSAELVEASRYFRLENGAFGVDPDAQRAALLGSWWPFLVAAIVCYGLLPRLLTLLISWQRFHAHLRCALPRLPGAPELLARMNSPLVSTSALQPETTAVPDCDGGAYTLELASGAKTRCALIAWSGSVPEPEAISRRLPDLGIEPGSWQQAGGARSTGQDEATIAAVCKERSEGVAVVAKAWEPPLLDFVDFLRNLRDRCSHHQPIIVLLWGGGEAVSKSDAEVWYQTLRQLKDPDLHIEALS